MEPTCQLTPEAVRVLTLRLFSKEQFRADPKGCVIAMLDWLDKAATVDDIESALPVKPSRDSRIERLDRIVQEQGLEVVSEKIGVSLNSLRAWLRGAPPNAASFAKIERFLENSQMPSQQQPRSRRSRNRQLNCLLLNSRRQRPSRPINKLTPWTTSQTKLSQSSNA
jgi:hypothetical protein